MLKKFFIVSAVILFLFSSCSNSDVASRLLHTEHLKQVADSHKEEIQWTMELEKTRLSERIYSIDYVSPENRLTPSTMMAFEAGMEHSAVFPRIEGFGSLDISDNDVEAMGQVSSFLNDLRQHKECDSYFAESSLYSLVLLLNDLNDFTFENCYWYYGKSFAGDFAVEIPVRLFNREQYADLNIFLKEMPVESDTGKSDTEKKDSKKNPVLKYKIIDVEIADLNNIHSEGDENGK